MEAWLSIRTAAGGIENRRAGNKEEELGSRKLGSGKDKAFAMFQENYKKNSSLWSICGGIGSMCNLLIKIYPNLHGIELMSCYNV